MRKIPIIFALFLMIALQVSAADKVPTADVEVVARLIEIPGKMPGNDLYNYVYIFKYKVIQVVAGNLKEKEILVGEYNPKIPRDQVKDKMAPFVKGSLQAFKAGEVHRLKLVKPIAKVWKDALEDNYFDDNSERWYALQTDAEKK